MVQVRKKALIVDGYNVVRSGSRYVHMRKESDYTTEKYNKVREALISDVAFFAGREYELVTVVFDGAENAQSEGKTQRIGGIQVIFSPYGSSADKVIEKLAYDARAKNYEVLVVTSDATVQDTVFGGGVSRMSANGFSREMDNLHAEASDEAQVKVNPKATLAERIDQQTLKKLEALRDHN